MSLLVRAGFSNEDPFSECSIASTTSSLCIRLGNGESPDLVANTNSPIAVDVDKTRFGDFCRPAEVKLFRQRVGTNVSGYFGQNLVYQLVCLIGGVLDYLL